MEKNDKMSQIYSRKSSPLLHFVLQLQFGSTLDLGMIEIFVVSFFNRES
jgi:hypothetical protein